MKNNQGFTERVGQFMANKHKNSGGFNETIFPNQRSLILHLFLSVVSVSLVLRRGCGHGVFVKKFLLSVLFNRDLLSLN